MSERECIASANNAMLPEKTPTIPLIMARERFAIVEYLAAVSPFFLDV